MLTKVHNENKKAANLSHLLKAKHHQNKTKNFVLSYTLFIFTFLSFVFFIFKGSI